MTPSKNHPWYHAATYIRAAFVEETNPIAVATAEKAARYLEQAAEHETETDKPSGEIDHAEEPDDH